MAPVPPPPSSSSFSTLAALAQHPRAQEMLGSVLTGMALGLVLLLVLSAFPGEPFDYPKPDGGRAEREKTTAADAAAMTKDEVEVGSTTNASATTATLLRKRGGGGGGGGGGGEQGAAVNTTTSNDEAEALHRLLAQEDRLWQQCQRLPGPLRSFLGLTEEKMRQAHRQATAAGAAGATGKGQGQGAGNGGGDGGGFLHHGQLSSRVDLIFYIVAFSALVYVLNRDYSNAASRLFSHLFPREATVMGMR